MQSKQPGRRGFLKGALVVGAAGAASMVVPGESAAQSGGATTSAPPPSSRTIADETGNPGESQEAQSGHVVSPGSDFMVDVMRAAGIEYVAIMTSSASRGLQESLVNYGGNKSPEVIVCCHEEAAAGMAHGYAKMAGKPMACLVHAIVGLQHASMAIYNAWCDRVPMIVMSANAVDATKRRPGVEWYHTAVDQGAMVRDFVKWDDAPGSLQNFAESFMRASTLAVTPPMEPVLIVADSELQEEPIHNRAQLRIPRPVQVGLPEGDPESVSRAARMLVGASNPLIVVDRAARSQEGVNLLVKLAESLNAPVLDLYGRMNFPSSHFLQQTPLRRQLVSEADVILGLEVADLWGVVNVVSDTPGRPGQRVAKPDAKVISISAQYLYQKSAFGDVQRYEDVDLAIGADVQTTLPALIDAIGRVSGGQAQAIAARKDAMMKASVAMRDSARRDAAVGWDASPISTARLCQEIWAQIKNEKWSLVSDPFFESNWPQLLWEFTEFKQFIGGSGGFGVGYGLPAAAGAALACKAEGRIAVNIQPDGDLLMVPSVLWTLAHHKIPLLSVMHNNRAWHQETMHVQSVAVRRDRNPTTWRLGTMVEEPYVDYATVAKGMGVWAEGPISDPAKLGPAIRRALEVVKSGRPALIDVVTQPR